MKVLFYIAGAVHGLSLLVFLGSIVAIISCWLERGCTQKGTATLLQVKERTGRSAGQWFEIAYTVDGVGHEAMVPLENVEGFGFKTPVGTQLPLWYDPKNPERFIITEDPARRKALKSATRTLKRSLIWMVISLGVFVFALSREEETADLPLNTTTIGQFSPDLSALAEKKPDKLIFTESIGAPDTFSITIDDPNNAKKVLNILLNAQVSKVGCQVDMVQYRYEEYRFVFGMETVTFGFLPHSYFCYNGKDYELGENRLSAVCDSLHAMAAEAAQWYGDDAELLTKFVDNGDEARSVTELTLTADGETLTGAIEGAYEVLSVEKQPDGYVIRYTYGDYYSHDTIRSSFVTVENGEMVISDIAQ